MTETQLRNQVVSIMQGWIGCKESDGSHKQILNVYNSYKPLPRGAKMLNTYAWCAATVSAAFIKAVLTDIAPVECSCSQMISLYKKIGRWIESDSYVPKPGDLLMYDWDDKTGKGDCTGAPEHVGMVVSVTGKVIRVLEGNKNDAVEYRDVPVDGRYIRGFCTPDYAAKAKAEQPKKVESARSFDKAQAGTYTVTASSLNLRCGAGTGKAILKSLARNSKVTCYGYYTRVGDTPWLYVMDRSGTVGFCSKQYLK